MPKPLKRLHWYLSEASLEDFTRDTIHSVFMLPDLRPYSKPLFELHDIVMLSLQEMEKPDVYEMGFGEIISVKACRLADVDEVDLTRANGSFRTRAGILAAFRDQYPNYTLPINMGTVITLYTVRRNDYDLKPLDRYVRSTLPVKSPPVTGKPGVTKGTVKPAAPKSPSEKRNVRRA